MESTSALLNSIYSNMIKTSADKDINHERIKKKIELRHNEIDNILFSARKSKQNDLINKKEEEKVNIQILKDLEMPSDFQINTFKYYESVIFLWYLIILLNKLILFFFYLIYLLCLKLFIIKSKIKIITYEFLYLFKNDILIYN